MKIQFHSEVITVFESALYRTTSTLLHLNEELLLVDPNWLPGEIHFIKKYISEHFPNHKLNILFTHSDYDHIIGYGAFPGATTIGSLAFAQSTKKSSILKQISDFDNTYYIDRDYPVEYPRLDHIINKDGQIVKISGVDIHFFLAPGHTDDGIFALIPELNVWIAGDYLSNIEIPMVDGNFTAYASTLIKLSYIFVMFPTVTILIPGHGDLAHGMDDILLRIRNDMNYLSCFDRFHGKSDLNDNEDISEAIKEYGSNPQLTEIHKNNVQKWLSEQKKEKV
jgi:hydroxyacylglutathione hydrolase